MGSVSGVLESRGHLVSVSSRFLVREIKRGSGGGGSRGGSTAPLLTSPSGNPSNVNLSSTSSCVPLSQLTFPNSNGHPSCLKPSSIARRRYLPSAGLG